jgi:hypothetical protein
MSRALWFNDCALLELIERAAFVEGRIYLDMGTAEGDNHVNHVRQLHQQLLRKGYRPGETLFYVEEDNAVHDEDAWARRLRTALISIACRDILVLRKKCTRTLVSFAGGASPARDGGGLSAAALLGSDFPDSTGRPPARTRNIRSANHGASWRPRLIVGVGHLLQIRARLRCLDRRCQEFNELDEVGRSLRAGRSREAEDGEGGVW